MVSDDLGGCGGESETASTTNVSSSEPSLDLDKDDETGEARTLVPGL